MHGARDLASFGVKALADEAAFLRAVTHPLLVWSLPPAETPEPTPFNTDPGARPRPAAGHPVFFALVKSAKNAFAEELTLGRSPNNDLIIADNSVSRFHAYFSPPRGGPCWKVIDAKSTAGTWVAGRRIEPKVHVALTDEVMLRFGNVELQFFDPPTFLKYCRRLAKAR